MLFEFIHFLCYFNGRLRESLHAHCGKDPSVTSVKLKLSLAYVLGFIRGR